MNKSKRKLLLTLVLFICVLVGFTLAILSRRKCNPDKSGLNELKAAYPDFIVSVDENALQWKDGSTLNYDDCWKKDDYDYLLNNADLEDQMSIKYPAGVDYEIPYTNFDPGRLRNEEFFKKMYGATKEEVSENIVTIEWLPNYTNVELKVTSINGIDKKLKSISAEIEQRADLIKYADNPKGGFNWRFIAGTDRLSSHSFGIAVDIDIEDSNYWKWEVKGDVENIPYKNRIPLELVEIFERHGFIWGGKWYHYDTMHFEYRPELLIQ